MGAQIARCAGRLLIAVIFIYAGVVKIWDFENGGSATPDFFQAIVNYHLLPWDAAMMLAVFLPWLEIITGVALLLPRWRRGALLLLAGQTSMFIGALTIAWWRKLDINCGCFGREQNTTDFRLRILVDFALLTVICFLLWDELTRMKKEEAHPPKYA